MAEQQHALSPHQDQVRKQVARQSAPPRYVGKRSLDFSPFGAALAGMSRERRQQIADMTAQATISQIQRRLRAGDLTSVDLVLWSLHRIQAEDADRLNSIIELNPDVLEIAHRLDAERAAGQEAGPLHGIPVLLKDNIATGDRMHTTAGALALATAHADRDAFIVERLRKAGALILGKTNLSEWANLMTSNSSNGFSALGGQTHHPLGAFDVSGSSSGSAVAVAAGFAPLSVGTETSGSIISPASQNGVVGLKPSIGLVSRDRIIPITGVMDTAGPMAASVTDLAILFNILMGVDGNDPATTAARQLAGVDFTHSLDRSALAGVRVGLVTPQPERRIEDNLLLANLAAILQHAGAAVVDAPLPVMELDYGPIFFHDLARGVDAYLAATGAAPMRSLAEIVSFNEQDSANRAPYGQDLLVKSVLDDMSDDDYQTFVTSSRTTAAGVLRQMMHERKVELLASLGNTMTRLYSPAGFPALTIPCGRRSNGEPVGLTFVGEFLHDARLMGAAYAFEQARREIQTARGNVIY
jgi:amidase